MTTRLPQVGVRLAAVNGKAVQRELKRFGKEGEAALRRIEKASKPASRGLKAVDRAASDVRGSATALAGRAGPLGSALTAIGPAGAAAAVGLGALTLGLTKALRISRDAVRDFDELAKTARTTGLSTDLFQSLQLAADEQGIAQRKLNTSLAAFVARSGEASVSTGTLYQRLKQLTPEFLEQFQAAGSVEERLRVLASAVQSLDSAEQQAALTAAAFGQRNIDMARIVGNTEESFDQLTARARDLGIVVEKDVLDRAEEMENKLGVAARVIDINLKQAFIDLAPVIVTSAEAIASVAAAINTVIDSTRDLEDRTSANLGSLEEIELGLRSRRDTVQRELNFARSSQDDAEIARLETEIEQLSRRIGGLMIERRHRRSGLGGGPQSRGGARRRSGEDPVITQADRDNSERWRERLITLDQKRADQLAEIKRQEDLFLKTDGEVGLSKEKSAAARVLVEEEYQRAIKRSTSARSKDNDLLREVQSLLKASETPAGQLEKRLERIAELQSGGAFDKATGGRGEAAAQAARVQAMREYLSAAEDTGAALEHVRSLAESGLGAETLAAQIALSERAAESFGKTMERINGQVADGLTDAIFEARNFGETMQGVARQLTRDFLNSQLRGLFGRIGSGLGAPGSSGATFVSSLLSSLTGGRRAPNGPAAGIGGLYNTGGYTGPGAANDPAGIVHKGEYVFSKRATDRLGLRVLEALHMVALGATSGAQIGSPLAPSALPGGGFAGHLMRQGFLQPPQPPARPAPQAVPRPEAPAPVVNIYNSSGAPVETRQRQTPNGGQEMDVVVGEVDRSIAAKIDAGTSKTAQAIARRFGLNRAKGL